MQPGVPVRRQSAPAAHHKVSPFSILTRSLYTQSMKSAGKYQEGRVCLHAHVSPLKPLGRYWGNLVLGALRTAKTSTSWTTTSTLHGVRVEIYQKFNSRHHHVLRLEQKWIIFKSLLDTINARCSFGKRIFRSGLNTSNHLQLIYLSLTVTAESFGFFSRVVGNTAT